MKKKMWIIVVVVLMLLLTLSGCIPGDGSYIEGHQANFISGIWHGWIAPVTLVLGLFNHSIRIYEVNNTGWWYDLGYYMAIISGFGGLSLFRKKKKKD